MSEEVEFEIVDPDEGTSHETPDPRRELDADRFPLAGPIMEGAPRELRGRCSSCDSRLRIRVRAKGTVRVRCPICGHARTIDV